MLFEYDLASIVDMDTKTEAQNYCTSVFNDLICNSIPSL